MAFTKVAPAGIGTSPGSTIRLGDSLLHSTGLDIGVGSGIGVTIRQHGDATFTGIITASAFFGDGSGLEGVSSSGIGTPLSDDDTSDLNKAYYVNQELSIGSTVTVNHPDSAVASYTHYQDLVVTDDADFIVADGDTFIPDILGINTSGLPSPRTGATGGRIRAGTITNAGANGAPNFPNGITVTGIITASTINSTSNKIVVGSAVTANSDGVDTVGVITASSFKGDGSQLTGITGTTINSNVNNYLITGTGTAGTLQGESTLTYDSGGLNITGDTDRDGLKITQSGNKFGELNFNSNRSAAGNALGVLRGEWNSTEVAAIYLSAGDDTSNKDDGKIKLFTSPASGTGIQLGLELDQNGTVTKPKHPVFATRIHYNNSYFSTNTKIQMRAAHIDTRSSFSDANDRYVAPAAGRYYFYFFSNIDYNGDGTIAVIFKKNGSDFTGTEGGHIYGYAQNSGWHNLKGSIITNMAVNDYIEVWTSAANMKVDGNNYGQFGGYMIG